MDPKNNQSFSSDPVIKQPTVNNATANSTPVTASHDHKKFGPILAVLVLVLVLIAGALYMFGSSMNKDGGAATNTPSNSADAEAEAIISSQSVPVVTGTQDDPQSLADDLDTATAGLDEQGF